METSISNEIIKVLDALCDKFGIAVDWSSDNIVPYIEILMDKCVNYEIATSIYWIILTCIGGLVGVALCFFGYKAHEKYKEYVKETGRYDYPNDGAVSIIVGLVLLALFLCVAVCQIHDLIQCYVFPELTMIHQIQNLMK